MALIAWSNSTPFSFEVSHVAELLPRDSYGKHDPADLEFFSHVLDDTAAPSRLAPVTGHVAEALAAVVLADLGYLPIWHLEKAGLTGVDLLMQTPDETAVLAVEVKGTTAKRGRARLSRSQMSASWLAPPNRGMAEWNMDAEHVFGAIVAVSFPQMSWRCVLTDDFVTWTPVTALDQLATLGRVDQTVGRVDRRA